MRKHSRLWAGLLPLFLLPLVLLCWGFLLPPQYEQTYLGALSLKNAAMEQAEGRRVLLCGGSGAAFAVRSDLLEDALPSCTVVNLGMYAGLGSTVPLELAADALRPGDVVVFLPEQSGQTLSLFFGAEAMWQAADGDFWLLKAVRREDAEAMLAQLPRFAAQKARFYFTGSAPAGDGVYARSAFNARGDIASPLRAQNVMLDGWDADQPISFDPALPAADFIAYLNGYAALCERRGATLLFAFCPMNAAAVSQAERARAADYQAALETALDCPVLGSAAEAILDAEWFYDTNFHLNSSGAVVYTAALSRQLQGALGFAETASPPLPEKPQMAGTTTLAGNDADAPCFTWAETATGLRLTGLTAEGAARAALTIPTHCGGKPVTALDKTTFAGNGTVAEIVVQGNLTSLADGSFAGCTALRRIVLTEAAPSRCTVGAGLLDGTAAELFVPAASLAAYKTNYFWAVHAGRIRALDAPETAAPEDTPALPSAKPEGPCVCFDGNGGTTQAGEGAVWAALDTAHLRMNTLRGPAVFTRAGFALLCWNTAADGSGARIGLGSRWALQAGMTLYAEWVAEGAEGDFTWAVREESAWVTAWHGTETLCAVPAALGGLPVAGIAAGAFAGAQMDTLVLPPCVETVEPGAFTGSTVREVWLFDTLRSICDASFAGCDSLTTLHVNAAEAPAYSISYYAAFADKYDFLLSLRGQKKLVLFSGSSTRYGYDSGRLRMAYPRYHVANMGVYAYTNALPQLELIRLQLSPGDVLLHAPEFEPLYYQFCLKNSLDQHFFAMMEASYDMAAQLNLRGCTHAFDSLCAYLTTRADLPRRSYEESPNGYDDDGNHYDFPTYNRSGDFILPRKNGLYDGLLQKMRADYTTAPFTDELLSAMNREYQRYLDDGLTVLFTYTPRNRSSLTAQSTPKARAALDALLREQLVVPVISDMEKSLLSGVYFYLIDSHLSDEGVALWNAQIIKDLKPYLN